MNTITGVAPIISQLRWGRIALMAWRVRRTGLYPGLILREDVHAWIAAAVDLIARGAA